MTDSKDLKENYIDINKIAELKGLKSNRSLRIEINKENSKYISRKIKTKGGYTYEILFTSLEPEIQEKLLDEEIKSKSLVPINNIYNIEEPKLEFKTEKLKLEALAKIDLIKAFEDFSTRFDKQKEAKENFIALYNSGEYFKDIYKILGKISYSSLWRWSGQYAKNNNYEDLIPKYKCSKIDELKEIAIELGERPYYLMQDNLSIILKHLKNEPQIIIVDEVDYLIGNKNVIEVLRDIQDMTGVPIVLVGMGLIDKKISRFKHFEDRIYKKLKFEHFDISDIEEILNELTDLKFSEDAISYLSTRTNQFRQLVKLINKLEKLSKTNNLKEFSEYDLKGILNERSSVKIMPQIKEMYS